MMFQQGSRLEMLIVVLEERKRRDSGARALLSLSYAETLPSMYMYSHDDALTFITFSHSTQRTYPLSIWARCSLKHASPTAMAEME
jgi:hypothetical protein